MQIVFNSHFTHNLCLANHLQSEATTALILECLLVLNPHVTISQSHLEVAHMILMLPQMLISDATLELVIVCNLVLLPVLFLLLVRSRHQDCAPIIHCLDGG